MARKNIDHLIIELRGNGGGWDIQGKELFGYLMKSDSSTFYYQNQIAATKDSEFLKFSDLNPEDLKRADEFLTPLNDRTFKLIAEGNTTLYPQVPKKNRFRGKVYILFDEQCASTCAEFMAVAKSNNIGTLVGNEAGGAYEGGNGSTFISYQLPHSGIQSNSPLVKYEMAVTPVEPLGRGTLPDHRVMMTLEDILNGRDAQKEFIFRLIKNNP